MSYDIFVLQIKGGNIDDKLHKFLVNPDSEFPWLGKSGAIDKFIEELREKYPENDVDDFDEEIHYWRPPGIMKEENGAVYLSLNLYRKTKNPDELLRGIVTIADKYNLYSYNPQEGFLMLSKRMLQEKQKQQNRDSPVVKYGLVLLWILIIIFAILTLLP